MFFTKGSILMGRWRSIQVTQAFFVRILMLWRNGFPLKNCRNDMCCDLRVWHVLWRARMTVIVWAVSFLPFIIRNSGRKGCFSLVCVQRTGQNRTENNYLKLHCLIWITKAILLPVTDVPIFLISTEKAAIVLYIGLITNQSQDIIHTYKNVTFILIF